jgi:protein ImuB
MGDTAPLSDSALILKGSDGGRRVITAIDGRAQQMGLRVGMPVARAEAMFTGLIIADADPVADSLALDKLAIWALRHYSPIAAADPPDGLVLDIAGADHLYGGEAGLVSDIMTRLAERGITAYAALADSWGAAHGLARFGGNHVQIVEPRKTTEAIRNLPITALRLPSDTIEDLLVLGLDTIGELTARPRAPLAKSFGLRLLRRIDQALGAIAEPIEPVDTPELLSVHRIFAEPISAPETLEKYTRRLVGAMCDKLEDAGLGSRRLDLHFTRVDNRIETLFVATAKPVRDVKRLTRLMCDKIETVDPGWGVEKMVLVAAFAEPLVLQQTTAHFAAPPRPDVEELWDTLANCYGPERLYRVISLPTDIPERAVKRLPPTSPEVGSKRNAPYRRPKRLYRPPEPIQTLAALPDHPPRAFTWRGQRYGVACADGPERVHGEWWVSEKEAGKVRDYYILEVLSGERFWVFRGGDGQHEGTGSLDWYLQGKFD